MESMYWENVQDFWTVIDSYVLRLPQLPFIIKARFVSAKAE